MKTALLVLIALTNGVSVMAGCQRMQFTFNLKPWYENTEEENSCGDLENDQIETSITNNGIAKMRELGYQGVSASIVKKNELCNAFDSCSIHPGSACLPYCVDITFCTSEEMEAKGITILGANDIGIIQQYQIDEMRKDLPECLGIKNKFMLDMHFGFTS